MNRLKALPWTEILLFLLLTATVANYIELRRLEGVVSSVEGDVSNLSLQVNSLLLSR